jgi:hypothetical protein
MGDIWLRTLVKMGLDPKDADAKLTIFRRKLKEHFGKQSGGKDTLLNVQGNKCRMEKQSPTACSRFRS